MKITPQSAELLSYTNYPLWLVERSGRVCYKSEGKIDCTQCHKGMLFNGNLCEYCYDRSSKFIKKIINMGHESVLEHANLTFLFITDRGISHELVRHRLCAFSQESTRYVKYDGGMEVVEPNFNSCKSPETARLNWIAAMEEDELKYSTFRNNGLSPQWSRSVLPNSLKTEIVVSANIREWRHIFNLRLFNEGAHPQIRDLMKLAFNKIRENRELFVFFENLEE